MSMISFIFFGFVALVFVLLFFTDKTIQDEGKKVKTANSILLIASYCFVFYTDWRFAFILAAITCTTWLCAKNDSTRMYGILIIVAALAFFKYKNFFAISIARIVGADDTALHIIFPLGISFYTFSAISYLVDVGRGKTEQKSLSELALYLAFFPKITSGPIQRSRDFFAQIEKPRTVGWSTFEPGIQIFVFGLFKKLVLADRLAVFVNQVYATPLAFGSFTVFLAAVAYSFQIYFDFSGYSDMAIGVARILGIHLPRNFNLPYLAQNVTELWKRWHMTLSSWLQDYLYIPLGGNRNGKVRTYLNLMLTMVIGGIWHGANWTYLIWGALHGLALAVHKGWMALTGSSTRQHSLISRMTSILLTFLFTTFAWIFFRAESVSHATLIIGRIFRFERGLEQPYIWLLMTIVIYAIASVLAYVHTEKDENKKQSTKQYKTQYKKTNVSMVEGYYPMVDLTTFWGLVRFLVFCGLLLCLAYTGGSPFIYGKY